MGGYDMANDKFTSKYPHSYNQSKNKNRWKIELIVTGPTGCSGYEIEFEQETEPTKEQIFSLLSEEWDNE